MTYEPYNGEDIRDGLIHKVAYDGVLFCGPFVPQRNNVIASVSKPVTCLSCLTIIEQ